MAITSTPAWVATPQPGYQINSAALSADGRVCLLGTSEEYGNGNFAVFCYDDKGGVRWQDALGINAYQGVFWVALNADGSHAAAGGTISDTANAAGFLRAYDAADGTRLLDVSLPSRVNQVALSARGDVLAAVVGSTLLVYGIQADGYELLGQHAFDTQYCQSCAISADGSRIVVGTTRDYTNPGGSAGTVTVFEQQQGALVLLAQCQADVGIMRVAMLADGSWWAASRHDGKAMAFSEDASLPAGLPAWTYGPAGLALDVAYAIAVARTDEGHVHVVCGANLQNADHGCLYAARSVLTPAVTRCYEPLPLWQNTLQFDPNPGVNMDHRGTLVTATDGQPGQDGTETPGNFYLFSGEGVLQWRYPTTLMNWPMAVSAAGNAVFGASDDGSAYYWSLAHG